MFRIGRDWTQGNVEHVQSTMIRLNSYVRGTAAFREGCVLCVCYILRIDIRVARYRALDFACAAFNTFMKSRVDGCPKFRWVLIHHLDLYFGGMVVVVLCVVFVDSRFLVPSVARWLVVAFHRQRRWSSWQPVGLRGSRRRLRCHHQHFTKSSRALLCLPSAPSSRSRSREQR